MGWRRFYAFRGADFAPDAIDSIFEDTARFSFFKGTDQTSGAHFWAEFDMLRQSAEARMLLGSGFPDEFVSALCVQNAALSNDEKTVGLLGSVYLVAPIVWVAWSCGPTGCSRGGGHGHGLSLGRSWSMGGIPQSESREAKCERQ